MKNILLAFLFCFVAILYAAPPEATPAPPEVEQVITIQKAQPVEAIQAQKEISNFISIPQAAHVGAQDNSQILPHQFWRQSENKVILISKTFYFSANPYKPNNRQLQADKTVLTTKILPSLPHYFWGDSKVTLSKTR